MIYDISETARRDLFGIFDFGATTWAEQQAENYLLGLYSQFDKIAQDPTQFQGVDHIKQDRRRCVFKAHSIYFKIKADRVTILAILRSQNTTSLK